jgi:hypothetical protein
LRLTLQQLRAVFEKCYFPLAETRKKRKMFSHTLLGPDEIRVLQGGAGYMSIFLLLLNVA